ncbi:drap deaminase [Moniliophthora roreri MCA 2997]|uniref:Drap deaminase n=2 Tax=Moniliophthora roreri TaxID=221103 RepID=V2X5W0_MONRO|nr:drap deaminase [Moniliophthora roreri MCA 2997]KAI3614081.1 drap deaminase [Moniliophthora roreri]
MTSLGGAPPLSVNKTAPGLKKIPAYWYPYTTYAKERWLGRELLEVVSTEFRDRSMEYYRYALESGVTTINGETAKPDTVIQNGDRIENVVHRHEPPVTATPVKVLLEDKEREFLIVDKPGSIPVHACGRYHRNTLVAILNHDFGYEKVYTVNRLDRLTSGLMIIPTSANCARRLTEEFVSGTVRKEYVARCIGKFPEGEIVCEEPLLTVDRQMGLNIVHPEGKPAETLFQLIRYDPNTDTSVVHCKPMTGRSHQIRVHLQYLGHPIANDPVYSELKIWGDNLGKGGIDIIPTEERSPPKPPEHLTEHGNSESLSRPSESEDGERSTKAAKKLLPRETGEDIGMGSPVPLSSEAVGVITRLRNMKDEAEDWSRWRDVIFKAKGTLRAPRELALKKPPPRNKRQKAKGEFINEQLNKYMGAMSVKDPTTEPSSELSSEVSTPLAHEADKQPVLSTTTPSIAQDPTQLTTSEAVERARSIIASSTDPNAESSSTPEQSTKTHVDETVKLDQAVEEGEGGEKQLYCPECYLPLHPDPKPESLYIFLHALRYTTSLGTFETEMPEWSAEGWEWDRS